MTIRRFKQVDVFSTRTGSGNPVAVVVDAAGLADSEMAGFAAWTNLSETAFVLAPTDPAADYRVRIFTPGAELDFAGHPTIGTCHAWLEAGGVPTSEDRIVQECGIGLVELRDISGRIAFAAPELERSGPVDTATLSTACRVLGVPLGDVVDAAWCDNGPGWLAVRLASADAVLALEPDFGSGRGEGIGVVGAHPLGVVGSHDEGTDAAVEVRAFFRSGTTPTEDPVTGSLNAALAQWLLGDGTLRAPYVASQGTALGRSGRVHVDELDGSIWVGGHAVTGIDGSVNI